MTLSSRENHAVTGQVPRLSLYPIDMPFTDEIAPPLQEVPSMKRIVLMEPQIVSLTNR